MTNFPLANVIGYLHPDTMDGADFEVHHDSDLPEPFTIPVWDTEKLGPVKTIAEYRTVSESPQFKAWYRNWYRARKIAHGHTPESAEAKVKRAFGEQA